MKDETLRTIFEDAFAVTLNMNDTFYYACADAATIDMDELEDLEPVIEKCGYQAFVAYEAIRRGHDPQIPQKAAKPEFQEAKRMILDMMGKAEEYGEFYELRMSLKEQKALTVRERKRVVKYKMRLKRWFSFFRGGA